MSSAGIRLRSAMVQVSILVCYLYAISVMIAAPYYNWRYARENGFAKWLFLGEIVPTAKALVWPYYAFHRGASPTEESKPLTQQQISRMQIMTMIRALDAAQQATFISNTHEPGVPLSQAQLDRMIQYDIQAIRSANSTDEETLNHIYPELGTRLKRQFVEGRRLFVSGMRNHSDEDLMKSKELDDSWADWYMANRKAIEDASNQAIR